MSSTVYVLFWGVRFSLGVLVFVKLPPSANTILKWSPEALCHKGFLLIPC